MSQQVALITGGARRIGAQIAEHLAVNGYALAIHYRNSSDEAEALATRLRAHTPVQLVQADLLDPLAPARVIAQVIERYGRLDALVNNASGFYPTALDELSLAQYDELMISNARAPLFLCQAAAPQLKARGGAIVNMVDIYAERPLPRYVPYCMAKAALVALTYGLARELGPQVRVNAVAPGNILWSENLDKADTPEAVRERTALQRSGEPADIARAVAFLLREPYITGQVLRVDGGRWLNI
jgi:pteridine reductase